MNKPIEVDILQVMRMLEKVIKSPADRWKELKKLIKKQKAANKAAK